MNQHKSITQLSSRSLRAFTEALSEGMALIAEHVVALATGTSLLADMNSPRGVEVLRVVAEEEAAKYLILLDAARFDYKEQKDRSRQLKRFIDHLPKGIYARSYHTSPATYGEIVRYAEGFLDDLYLDGPNDVDWIFRNEVLAERDERLYVDFVNSDEGGEWWTPARFDVELDPPLSTVKLVRSLARGNVHNVRAIDLSRELWADFDPHDDTHWVEAEGRNAKLVEQLKALSIATPEFDDNDAGRIRSSLLFPLNRLDMHMRNVKPEELRAQQQRRMDELLKEIYGEPDY
jgi:hypothetical protein